MPVWLQSMRSPIDINKMAFDFTPEGFAPDSGVYAIRSHDGIESLESLTRHLSIGEAMDSRPPLVTVRPPAVHRPGSSCSISSNSSETTVVPPIHNKNYQESRYKTELCRHWEEKGTCPHGTQCLFAHGLIELRAFRGRHKKFKTQMCKAFHTTGFCSFGTRCSYIHEGRDVIPLLVQKYGYEVLNYLPADNEALLRFVNANPEMLSTNEFQTIAKVQMTARVETVTKAQTAARLPTLTTGTSPVKAQSPPRLSVFSKICNN